MMKLYAIREASRKCTQTVESVSSISGDLERDDVINVLVSHANKEYSHLYVGQELRLS
jgi:hypothetical protein